MLIDSSNTDQCFCFPSPTSQTTECIFCCLHLSEQCYSLHTYLLVSTRRLRTEISKSDLLYLIFNHHAVYMCKPVLPQRGKVRPSRRNLNRVVRTPHKGSRRERDCRAGADHLPKPSAGSCRLCIRTPSCKGEESQLSAFS